LLNTRHSLRRGNFRCGLHKGFCSGPYEFFRRPFKSYEGELIEAREGAIREMKERAIQMGANAIIGVDIDYEVLGQGGNMLMVTASGTAW